MSIAELKVPPSTNPPIEKSLQSFRASRMGSEDWERMSDIKVVLLTMPSIQKGPRPDFMLGETTVVEKRLSIENARLLIPFLCDYEGWMRDHKAQFERQHGRVDAYFASTIADPDWLELPDGRPITIYDRSDEDIDTANVRTYDVFFDQGGFRIEHTPLKQELSVWSDYEPKDLPRWLYSRSDLRALA